MYLEIFFFFLPYAWVLIYNWEMGVEGKNQHLLKVYYVSEHAFQMFHLILSIYGQEEFYYFHFVDEENKTQRR